MANMCCYCRDALRFRAVHQSSLQSRPPSEYSEHKDTVNNVKGCEAREGSAWGQAVFYSPSPSPLLNTVQNSWAQSCSCYSAMAQLCLVSTKVLLTFRFNPGAASVRDKAIKTLLNILCTCVLHWVKLYMPKSSVPEATKFFSTRQVQACCSAVEFLWCKVPWVFWDYQEDKKCLIPWR